MGIPYLMSSMKCRLTPTTVCHDWQERFGVVYSWDHKKTFSHNLCFVLASPTMLVFNFQYHFSW